MLATHSPSLVRASSATSQVLWMSDGTLRSESEDQVRQRMGWGALDKDLLLITEDGNLQYMKNILAQWPDLARKVLLWPAFGSGSLPRGSALARTRGELGIAVAVHRDRDFLSDTDKAALIKKMEYDVHNIPFWMPAGSDIEAGFCSPEQLEKVFEIDRSDAIALLGEAVALVDADAAETDFNTAYQSATGGLSKDEVSVPSKRWRELAGPCAATIKGKMLLTKVEEAAKARYIGTADARKLKGLKLISNPAAPMHEDLKALLEQAILTQKPPSRSIKRALTNA